jgi:hypothetical protein
LQPNGVTQQPNKVFSREEKNLDVVMRVTENA